MERVLFISNDSVTFQRQTLRLCWRNCKCHWHNSMRQVYGRKWSAQIWINSHWIPPEYPKIQMQRQIWSSLERREFCWQGMQRGDSSRRKWLTAITGWLTWVCRCAWPRCRWVDHRHCRGWWGGSWGNGRGWRGSKQISLTNGKIALLQIFKMLVHFFPPGGHGGLKPLLPSLELRSKIALSGLLTKEWSDFRAKMGAHRITEETRAKSGAHGPDILTLRLPLKASWLPLLLLGKASMPLSWGVSYRGIHWRMTEGQHTEPMVLNQRDTHTMWL